MRIVVTGATGNVGSALLQTLSAEPAIESVLGPLRAGELATGVGAKSTL